MNFGARNQYAPEAGKLPEHFTANESADCFFAHAQLSGAAFHVEGLAFGCRCCIHHEATYYNSARLLWCSAYTDTCRCYGAGFMRESSNGSFL